MRHDPERGRRGATDRRILCVILLGAAYPTKIKADTSCAEAGLVGDLRVQAYAYGARASGPEHLVRIPAPSDNQGVAGAPTKPVVITCWTTDRIEIPPQVASVNDDLR